MTSITKQGLFDNLVAYNLKNSILKFKVSLNRNDNLLALMMKIFCLRFWSKHVGAIVPRKFEATVSNNVYCLHHLQSAHNKWNLPWLCPNNEDTFNGYELTWQIDQKKFPGQPSDMLIKCKMHPLQSVETERKFKRVIQTEHQ